jgi:hypothetical protein
MADFVNLTRNQIKAISALLSTQTIAEAAKLTRVGERTLHRWLTQEDFRAALFAAAGESISGAVRRLVAGRDAALDTIYDLMQNAESENVRRLAARDWLDTLQQSYDLEIFEERISALERASQHGKKR